MTSGFSLLRTALTNPVSENIHIVISYLLVGVEEEENGGVVR
jgi:hypothetical protein